MADTSSSMVRSASARPPATLRATLLVAAKELRGSFRDRQTLMYGVLLPLCLYPLIFWCLVQGSLFVQGRAERTEVKVGLALPEPRATPEGLREALQAGSAGGVAALVSAEESTPRINRVEVQPSTRPLDEVGARDWLERRWGDAPDAVLWMPPAEASGAADASETKLFFNSTGRESRLARKRVEERLEPFAEALRARAAEERGLRPDALVPFEVMTTNVAPERDMLAYLLSFLLPILLVMMCVMGAFFPAVDLTAGEKERSTAETTLLLPVPRAAVHQGKILAVCVTAVIATALNLGALGLSAGHLLGLLSDGWGSSLREIPVLALLAVTPLALLFAFFVSAVLTGFSALTASFKEGQALLGPVQLAFVLPAFAGVMPGIEPTLPLAFVPVLDVVLAFRAMLQGEVLPAYYALTALALLLYALLATRLAVAILSREQAQLARETIPIHRLLRLLRSPAHAS